MFKALTLAAFLALGTAGLAQAAEPAAVISTTTTTVQKAQDIVAKGPHQGPHHMGPKDGPCAEVFQACKQAGYTRGGMKDGKGLMENCIKPLDAGQKVAGVTIDNAKVQACKTAHDAKKAEFDAKMKNDPEFAKKMNERKAKWEARKATLDKAMAPPAH